MSCQLRLALVSHVSDERSKKAAASDAMRAFLVTGFARAFTRVFFCFGRERERGILSSRRVDVT